MADNRMSLRCKICGGELLLAKGWFGSGWRVWEGRNPESISRVADSLAALSGGVAVRIDPSPLNASARISQWLHDHDHDEDAWGTHFELVFEHASPAA